MKAAILAGGYGTRISEETNRIPKPMVEIGGKPIIWHIMKLYSFYGVNEFVILLGYKGYVIKEYFAHYFLHQCDITFDMETNERTIHNNVSEPWKITLVDTGEGTLTGGRLLRARKYLSDGTFMLTYGDGVSDVNINELQSFHKSSGGIATMTSVLPEGRYGAIDADSSGKVFDFIEKPKGDGQWVNAGFFVFEPEVFNYLSGDCEPLEQKPLMKLANDGEFYTYRHNGFWRPMDTMRDKVILEEMWQKGAPWKIW